jgi:DNA-binding protein Fis
MDMINELTEQEIPVRKISLERMKARSREFRESGKKSVSRSSMPQGLRSLILSAADGRLCPTCDVAMQHCRGNRQAHYMATIEHILPIKEGGLNEPENLIAMCLACNRSRGYAYNQTRKSSRQEIDSILEWLWLHINKKRLSNVVDLRLEQMHPIPQTIFKTTWRRQHLAS